MIKNIIFDFGNVIGNFDYNEVIGKFTDKKEEKEFLINEVINSDFWIGLGLLDSGLISYEGVIKLINDKTNNIYPDLVEKLIMNYYKYIYISDEIKDVVKSIKEKEYNLYILSNTSKEVVEYFKDNSIFDYFDGFVLSYKINMLKPYESIFKYTLDKFNLIPSECLFIDDRKDNVETANRLGIKGRNVNKDDVNDIIKALKEYEIL